MYNLYSKHSVVPTMNLHVLSVCLDPLDGGLVSSLLLCTQLLQLLPLTRVPQGGTKGTLMGQLEGGKGQLLLQFGV